MSRARGFALAAVLFALVLVSALTAVSAFAALQEWRAARNVLGAVRARAAAAGALARVVAAWDPPYLDSMPTGATIALPLAAPPGVQLTMAVRRLSDRLFLAVATASDDGGVARALMQPLRLRVVTAGPPVVVRTRAIDPALVPLIAVSDAAPPGWSCPPASGASAPVLLQPLLPDSAFLLFGDRSWAALVRWATAIPPGGDSLAVRYEAGDATLAGGRFTGTLVVEGDLRLSSAAQVIGQVFVRGRLIFEGAGGSVFGVVVASQVIAQSGFMYSGVIASHSSCATLRTGRARAFAEPVPGLGPVLGQP